MPRPVCGLCKVSKAVVNTVSGETWICVNCDQYPWIIEPMTKEQVMEQSARARAKVEEAQGK